MNQEEINFIKTLENREKTLEEGEKAMIGLTLKNIEHKRAFLGTLMTIATAVIAGLFILLVDKNLNSCFNLLAIMSGLGFAVFIISSSIYLTAILAQESLSLDKHLRFIRESKKDFIKKVGTTITDINSYEEYRKQKYKEEKESKQEVRGSHEIWFVLINTLFIFSFLLLLILLIMFPLVGI